MYRKRIKKLTTTFAALGLLLFIGVCYRMLIQGDELSSRAYIEQPMLERIESLVEQGIIIQDQGSLKIDHQRLLDSYGPAFTNFVEERKRFFSFVDDEFRIDHNAIKVSNRRRLQSNSLVERGRIFDRKGRVLAETVQNEEGNYSRNYAYGPIMLPVVGVTHPLYGVKGLESILSPWLSGQERSGGLRSLYRFFSGRKKSGEAFLSLDAEVQKTAYQALGTNTGSVVVLDVRTGEIIAAASTPSFNPATSSRDAWEAAADLGYKGPFTNRGLQRRYPPGSTFKLVTATAVIDQKEYDPKSRVVCKGEHPKYGIHDYRGKRHGWIGLRDAFKLSCNVYFGDAAVQLGPELLNKAEEFGFNRRWDLVKQDRYPFVVRSLAFTGIKSVRGGGRWEAVDFKVNPKLVAQGGIGQNVVTATPLQMAMVAAAIGNGGKVMHPTLVQRISFAGKAGDGNGLLDWWSNDTRVVGQVCSKKNAEILLEMMSLVMEKGTAFRLPKMYKDGDKYKLGAIPPRGKKNVLAGKTGTAETGTTMGDHSWFVAVAPVDNPRYAIAAMVEHAGLGAKVAGPVAVKTMLAALNSE